MKLNFLTRYFEPDANALIGAAAAIPGAQLLGGIVQTIGGAQDIKRLLQQRRPFQTPEEYYQILQAAESLASQGFDPFTLSFLTNQTDRAFGASAGAATRLGADPNALGMLFDQKMQGVFKIGAENAAKNLENFTKYISALDLLGQNDAAEQKSREDLLKDKLQAAATEKQQGIQNVISAANAFLGLAGAAGTAGLYGSGSESNYRVYSAGVEGNATPRPNPVANVSTGSQDIFIPNKPAR